MRRAATAFVVLLAAFVLNTSPLGADSTTPLNREVSGPFSGTTFFDFFTHGCSFIHQSFDGTYATAVPGTGTFHLDVCPTFAQNIGTIDAGTFTLRDRRGSVLNGTVTGTYDARVTPNVALTFTLHAESGTRGFRNVHGSIALVGEWNFVGNPGPISGTLVGELER